MFDSLSIKLEKAFQTLKGQEELQKSTLPAPSRKYGKP
jgi:hypothetical protein